MQHLVGALVERFLAEDQPAAAEREAVQVIVRGRGTADRLRDVLSAAEDALAFAAPLDPAAFATLPETDRRTYRALKNALAEIGQAIKLLPPDLLARHPLIDWRGWAGCATSSRMETFDLDMTLLRPTVVDELPILIAAIATEPERQP